MTLKIIIQDAEQDIVKAAHAIEAFADHVAEKIAEEFGLEKNAVAATITQAVHSVPTTGESVSTSSTVIGSSTTSDTATATVASSVTGSSTTSA